MNRHHGEICSLFYYSVKRHKSERNHRICFRQFPVFLLFGGVQTIMDHFILHSEYQPTGDQPEAIDALVRGFEEGDQFQTLLGVTGSGKTFTMANVIQQLQKPTLIIAHNKTLAAQLYSEFKEFFPENAVEYFVSY